MATLGRVLENFERARIARWGRRLILEVQMKMALAMGLSERALIEPLVQRQQFFWNQCLLLFYSILFQVNCYFEVSSLDYCNGPHYM